MEFEKRNNNLYLMAEEVPEKVKNKIQKILDTNKINHVEFKESSEALLWLGVEGETDSYIEDDSDLKSTIKSKFEINKKVIDSIYQDDEFDKIKSTMNSYLAEILEEPFISDNVKNTINNTKIYVRIYVSPNGDLITY